MKECAIVQIENGKLPLRQTDGSAGYDLYARTAMRIPMGVTEVIPAGFAIAIPTGYVGLICSRSGLAKIGVFVLNAPGVIDSDYRGEVGVILYNGSGEPFEVKAGDRIAQMLFQAVERPDLFVVKELPSTDRRGGFGSTGMR